MIKRLSENFNPLKTALSHPPVCLYPIQIMTLLSTDIVLFMALADQGLTTVLRVLVDVGDKWLHTCQGQCGHIKVCKFVY